MIVIGAIAVTWSVLSPGYVLKGPMEPGRVMGLAILAYFFPMGLSSYWLIMTVADPPGRASLTIASLGNGLWWSPFIYSLWSIACGAWDRRKA